jgi:lipopolysaccharide/colanic/teichoic acid biosynthesis glycosyltransferase
LTTDQDVRFTRIGGLLSKLKIDEIPQLLHVVRGDMSLVGPRPEAPSIVERYTPEQREVFQVRPGITGPTQLDWLDEATRVPADAEPVEYYLRHLLPAKLASDLCYVKTRTFAGDIRLLLRTPFSLGHSVLARPRLGRRLKATWRRPV